VKLKKKKIKNTIRKYIKDLSKGGSGDAIVEKHKQKFFLLAKSILQRFSSYKDVEEYLEHVLSHIDGLNEYFKAQGSRSKIPYSKLIVFAVKDELLDEFLLQKGIESRKKDTVPMLAGLEESGDAEADNLSSLCISSGGNDYYCIYEHIGFFFFFSAVTRKILVQIPGGKTLSFKKYQNRCKKRGELFATRVKLFKRIRKSKNKSDSMIAFQIYIRQEKAKIARRKLTERSLRSRN